MRLKGRVERYSQEGMLGSLGIGIRVWKVVKERKRKENESDCQEKKVSWLKEEFREGK